MSMWDLAILLAVMVAQCNLKYLTIRAWYRQILRWSARKRAAANRMQCALPQFQHVKQVLLMLYSNSIPMNGAAPECKGRGKREIPEKTRRTSGVTRPGIEPSSQSSRSATAPELYSLITSAQVLTSRWQQGHYRRSKLPRKVQTGTCSTMAGSKEPCQHSPGVISRNRGKNRSGCDHGRDSNPGPKANPFPTGSLRIFARDNLAGPCRWSTGFLGVLPFIPPSHSNAAPYSPRFTHIDTYKSSAVLGDFLDNVLKKHRTPSQQASFLSALPTKPAAASFKWKIIVTGRSRIRAALNNEVSMRAIEVSMGQRRNEGGGGNGISPRKPADQRHRPGTIPTFKNPERTGRGLNPRSSVDRAARWRLGMESEGGLVPSLLSTTQRPQSVVDQNRCWCTTRRRVNTDAPRARPAIANIRVFWRTGDMIYASVTPTPLSALVDKRSGLSLVTRAAVAERLAHSPPTKENLGSIPGQVTRFSHVGIVPRTMPLIGGFSRISPVSPGAAPYSPQSPSSALKTSLLRAVQIYSLNVFNVNIVYIDRNDVAGISFLRFGIQKLDIVREMWRLPATINSECGQQELTITMEPGRSESRAMWPLAKGLRSALHTPSRLPQGVSMARHRKKASSSAPPPTTPSIHPTDQTHLVRAPLPASITLSPCCRDRALVAANDPSSSYADWPRLGTPALWKASALGLPILHLYLDITEQGSSAVRRTIFMHVSHDARRVPNLREMPTSHENFLHKFVCKAHPARNEETEQVLSFSCKAMKVMIPLVLACWSCDLSRPPVAQLVGAPPIWGAGGSGFESRREDRPWERFSIEEHVLGDDGFTSANMSCYWLAGEPGGWRGLAGKGSCRICTRRNLADGEENVLQVHHANLAAKNARRRSELASADIGCSRCEQHGPHLKQYTDLHCTQGRRRKFPQRNDRHSSKSIGSQCLAIESRPNISDQLQQTS
ncbi:hypothetical protein PR048_032318 [Dryococelus australis]|uniref:Uncharacterized protein n=1 Tax=Dryococelus australis TaxID=614101 RepID=A0ABQ9G1W0_9NEOP|nr:hypothetical protein PR048_032318 [Dryococelus australis]